ncbi:MAG: SDR family NAD(P)-dependent oxidoreductase [Solirubrobacteraceae bacterium]|jgi:short-subunit dehydrogenase|nr:SDR family NAD(P)-dependent oxidoreductase [Solirubrobacteraceae bacterium]
MSPPRLPLPGPARRALLAADVLRPALDPREVARSVARVAGASAPLLPRRSLEDAVGGRTVLITGASYGIGRAAALEVAAAGATTLVLARGADALGELTQEIERAGGAAQAYPFDLNDLDAVDGLLAQIAADGHEVDVLVNNAARSIRRTVAESYDRFHDYERTMRLNYFAPVRLTLGVLPGMRERGYGHVVNVSTLATRTSTPRFSAYLASKGALEAFSRSVASECLGDDVRFTIVHMPLVRTPMSQATDAYEGMPAMSPERAAGLITEALRTRAEHVGPRVGAAAQIAHAVSPATANEVLHALYRSAPDPGVTPSR